MTPEQLAELEQRLLAACREAVGRGARIVPGGMDDGSGLCDCPFGALLVDKSYPCPGETAAALGLDEKEVGEFMVAFDLDTKVKDTPMTRLGRRLKAMALAGEFGS